MEAGIHTVLHKTHAHPVRSTTQKGTIYRIIHRQRRTRHQRHTPAEKRERGWCCTSDSDECRNQIKWIIMKYAQAQWDLSWRVRFMARHSVSQTWFIYSSIIASTDDSHTHEGGGGEHTDAAGAGQCISMVAVTVDTFSELNASSGVNCSSTSIRVIHIQRPESTRGCNMQTSARRHKRLR